MFFALVFNTVCVHMCVFVYARVHVTVCVHTHTQCIWTCLCHRASVETKRRLMRVCSFLTLHRFEVAT